MFSSAPIITDVGKTLLLRAAGGEKITFTKFQAGNGLLEEGETPETAMTLKNAILTNIGITQAQATEQDGYIQLTGVFNNQTDVQTDFRWTELGLIAKDEDDVEYLYAYGYDEEYAEIIRAGGTSVITEQTVSVIIAIGDSQNITAYILPNATYASKAAFDAHVGTAHAHGCTYSDVGAAAASHEHSADAITSGTLSASRGGTGVGSLQELADALSSLMSLGGFVCGTFTGDGKTRKNIPLGFQPSAVIIYTITGGTAASSASVITFAPGKNQYHSGCGNLLAANIDTILQRGHGGAGVTSTGFAVGYSSGARPDINVNGTLYAYIAFK